MREWISCVLFSFFHGSLSVGTDRFMYGVLSTASPSVGESAKSGIGGVLAGTFGSFFPARKTFGFSLFFVMAKVVSIART